MMITYSHKKRLVSAVFLALLLPVAGVFLKYSFQPKTDTQIASSRSNNNGGSYVPSAIAKEGESTGESSSSTQPTVTIYRNVYVTKIQSSTSSRSPSVTPEPSSAPQEKEEPIVEAVMVVDSIVEDIKHEVQDALSILK